MTLSSDAGEPSGAKDLYFGTPLNNLIGQVVEAQRARNAELVRGAQAAMGDAARQAAEAHWAWLGNSAREAAGLNQSLVGNSAREAAGLNQSLVGNSAREAAGLNQPLIGDIARHAAEAHRASIASLIRDPGWSVSGIPSAFAGAEFIGIERFASISLQPFLRSVKGVSEEYSARVARKIGEINVDALERHPDVADLAAVLDRDDAVEQLVASEPLQTVVEDVVESEPVTELIEHVDLDALQEDADEVLDHATGLVAALNGLTTGQIVTIFTAIDILVITTVMQVHGYNLGGVPGIVGLTLSPLAVYSFLNSISKQNEK